MSRVWYTSDTHFGHKFLALDIRGFSSIEEHDEKLIENWNKEIGVTDTVWHLGDFSLKKPEDFWPIMLRLNGIIHLIAGNHDRCFPGIRDSHKYLRQYFEPGGFDSVQAFARKKLDGNYVMLSHFPYSGDHSVDDRCSQYRLRNEGLPLIHGHTHDKEKISYGAMTLQIHVGMDAWDLKPVPQETILELLKAGF